LRQPEGKETVEDVKAWSTGYIAYLKALAAQSAHGAGPIEVPNSDHAHMALEEPQVTFIANWIIGFMTNARASSDRN
jgi:hypothetical protein